MIPHSGRMSPPIVDLSPERFIAPDAGLAASPLTF
jgi:hypothetical protein